MTSLSKTVALLLCLCTSHAAQAADLKGLGTTPFFSQEVLRTGRDAMAREKTFAPIRCKARVHERLNTLA